MDAFEKRGGVIELALHEYHAVIASDDRRNDPDFTRLLKMRRVFEGLCLEGEFECFGVTVFFDDAELPALHRDSPMVVDNVLRLNGTV